MIDGEFAVIDEIHTADSSRYWVADEYEARYAAGESQLMLDKENIRQWLLSQGYKGEGEPPAIPGDVRVDLAEKYVDLYQRLLGKDFVPAEVKSPSELYSALGA